MSENIDQRLNNLLDKPDAYQLLQLFESVLTDLTSIQTQYNQLRTDFNAHVHGGITAGAANSSAPTATTATAVALNTTT